MAPETILVLNLYDLFFVVPLNDGIPLGALGNKDTIINSSHRYAELDAQHACGGLRRKDCAARARLSRLQCASLLSLSQLPAQPFLTTLGGNILNFVCLQVIYN